MAVARAVAMNEHVPAGKLVEEILLGEPVIIVADERAGPREDALYVGEAALVEEAGDGLAGV